MHREENRSKEVFAGLAAMCCLSAWGLMTYADIDPRLLATMFAVVGVVAYFYSRKSATDLPDKRPSIAWMPKYRSRCTLSEAIRSSSDPARALVIRLGEAGFSCERQTPLALHFTRGHARGDFSVEIAKINLVVSLPIETEVDLIVEAGWLVAFDTGDLWQLTKELTALVADDPAHEERPEGQAA